MDLSALFQSIPQLELLDWTQNGQLFLSTLDLSMLSGLTQLKLAYLPLSNQTGIPLLFPQSCNVTAVDVSGSGFDLSSITRCPHLATLYVPQITSPFQFALIASFPKLLVFQASSALLSSDGVGVYAGIPGIITARVLANLSNTNPILIGLVLTGAVLAFPSNSPVDTWPHIVSDSLEMLSLSSVLTLRTGPNGPADALWLADLPALSNLALVNLYNVHLQTAAFELASPSLAFLFLTNTPVSGSLQSLCHLHQLNELYLDDCGIRSMLPTNISFCWPALTQLTAAGCALVGPLPDFRQLPMLTSLDLSANSLSGPMDDAFCADSPSVTLIKLATNQLTGPAPSLCGVGLGGVSLDLSANRISAFPNLTCYGTVTSIQLQNNPMDSEIPADFWDLISPRVTVIDFSYSLLHGSFPSRPLRFAGRPLRSFSISNTRLSGSLPRNIDVTLTADYSMARFTGPVILFDDDWPGSSRIHTLNLESAGVLTCPIRLGLLTTLYSLSLANASFQDCDFNDRNLVQLPPSIADIDLSDCGWTPFILTLAPVWLNLRANNANIRGLISPTQTGCSLKSLSLNGNALPTFASAEFSGDVSSLAMLYASESLEFFSCIGCQITAPLQNVLVNPDNGALGLRTLRLGNNCLDGQWYGGLAQSTALSIPVGIEEFSLANNPGIQGKLPTVSPAYSAFRSFDVSGTALTGSMLPSWGELSTLLQISINNTNIACTLTVDATGGLQCADQTVLTGSQSTQDEAASLADPAATVHCAALVIVATGSTNVNADPSYHAHTLCHCDVGGFGLHSRCYRCPEGCTCSQDMIQNCFPVVQRGSIAVNPPSDLSGTRIVVDDSISPFTVTALLPCPRTVTGSSLCNPDGIIWPSFYRIIEQTGSASVSVALTNSDAFSSSDSEIDLSDWCYPGHTGRLCAACSSGYFSSGRWCLRCLSEGVHVLILVANLLVIVALVAYLFFKSPKPAAAAKALVEYCSRMRSAELSFNGPRALVAMPAADDRPYALMSEPAELTDANDAAEPTSEAANPLKLLIFHSQQLSLLLQTTASMPTVIAGLMSAVSSGSNGFSLSSLVAMECLNSAWSIQHRCWLGIVAPLLIAAFAGLTFLFDRRASLAQLNRGSRHQFSRSVNDREQALLSVADDAADASPADAPTAPSSSPVPRIYSVCVSLLYLLVFPCAQTALSALTCTDTREGSDARVYLNLFPAQQCDAQWRRTILPPALIGALFWLIAFPLGSTLMLRRLKAQLHSASSDSSAAALSAWPICSDLLSPFAPRFWFWEQILLMRRLMLVAAVTIIPSSSLYLPLALFALIQLCALLQHWTHPYTHAMLNAGELVSLYLLLLNYISALILQTGLTDGGFHQTADLWAVLLFLLNFAFLLALVVGLFGFIRKWAVSKLNQRRGHSASVSARVQL